MHSRVDIHNKKKAFHFRITNVEYSIIQRGVHIQTVLKIEQGLSESEFGTFLRTFVLRTIESSGAFRKLDKFHSLFQMSVSELNGCLIFNSNCFIYIVLY